ncbi:MAG: DUF362 domain-containing protein [Candidatus Omnitrophota bacterium]
MKSKVYFIATETAEEIESVENKLKILIKQSQLLAKKIPRNEVVAVKLHFGEEKNTGFVKPQYVKVILAAINSIPAKPFLTDSNTLYKGKRSNSKEHLQLAKEHGFSQDLMKVAVRIVDEAESDAIVEVDINEEFIKTAQIIKPIAQADALVGIAHFKGHLMTGFGGALKNIGMGAASRRGKMQQHASVSPIILKEKCSGCADCIVVCPVTAISLKKGKATIRGEKCIGCARCINACGNSSIDIPWEQGAKEISQKMAEYAKAALMNKKSKCVFFNFAIKITKECDCIACGDPAECPDLGIFVSSDPVAIDKACVDLVNKKVGRDLFRELHPKRDWSVQLLHAEKIGIGTLDYELIKV